MTTANATAPVPPATHFNATLVFKAPGLYQLGPHFQPLQHSLPLDDTIDNVLSWVKREIVQRLQQEPAFLKGRHQGLIASLGEEGLSPPGFIFSHVPVTRSPIVSFATSVSATLNGKKCGEIDLDHEHAKRFIALQDLCLDSQQLQNMSIEIRATLRIAPKPVTVPAVTDDNMLHDLVHSRRQSAHYIRVGTVQDNRASKIGLQPTTAGNAAPHHNAILAQFDPFNDRSWTGKFHMLPVWTYDNFPWGLADSDASQDWSYETVKEYVKTNLWGQFDHQEPQRRRRIERERARQINLTAVARNAEARRLTRIPPERPQLTFNRLGLAQFGNDSGVGIPAAAEVHAIIHFVYHYQGHDAEDDCFPRNMQVRIAGNMTVDGLENTAFAQGGTAREDEDQILKKYQGVEPRPPSSQEQGGKSKHMATTFASLHVASTEYCKLLASRYSVACFPPSTSAEGHVLNLSRSFGFCGLSAMGAHMRWISLPLDMSVEALQWQAWHDDRLSLLQHYIAARVAERDNRASWLEWR
ncbi:uncharacterized protein MYCFIDRAFT_80737 [Pseudocercospora fijiensis CIRAD86]|uniref:Uncharacterized protein n=1 Tax=Pseudocercospora fijiensis (strain CIRAD86) TaxID=383855 RepID=M3A1R6_PSEFD|nr:uncharacterized protein MYCFIDRAFT_80737 [Pseudocercospora fijiensis CIRAD86]EME78316.1 hypothetical protein MYCFIDRAFT_80737 [Pseudocercospora fijiensis CIRAD86]